MSRSPAAGVSLPPVARRVVRRFLVGVATLASCGLAVLADGAGTASTPSWASASLGSTYFEEDDPAVTWSASWSRNLLAANSGGSARLAMDAGSQASFVFTGTGVRWIGYRDEWCGLANVSLDGLPQATVDTYSTPAKAQSTLYTITGLASGTHTLTIQATGTHDSASAGSWVWVDAFSVIDASAPSRAAAVRSVSFSPPDSPPPYPRRGSRTSWSGGGSRARRLEEASRVEQDDRAVSWSGAWSTNRLAVHSGGSARLSMEATSRVSFAFVGTGVTWIGYRDEWSGIADVSVDGLHRATVDTYSAPARAQAALFAIDGLPAGAHTLVIEPTARRGPASGGSWIWVDAFSVAH